MSYIFVKFVLQYNILTAMARRKNYPFHNDKKIVNFFSYLFAIPVSLASTATIDAINDASSYSMGSNTNLTYEPFKPLKTKIIHLICGSLFTLTPLLFIFLILEWWPFFALLFTLFFELLLATPTFDLMSKISTYYIYNNFDIKIQINTAKFVLIFWACIFAFHAIFIITFGFYILNYNPDFSSTYDYYLYEIKDQIIGSSPITLTLATLIPLTKAYISIHFLKWQQNIIKNISNNKSICQISKWSTAVDNNILFELYDRPKQYEALYFDNGCSLQKINLSGNIMTCGFVLRDKTGRTSYFYFQHYATSQGQLLKNANKVFTKIAQDINARLKEHNISNTINIVCQK